MARPQQVCRARRAVGKNTGGEEAAYLQSSLTDRYMEHGVVELEVPRETHAYADAQYAAKAAQEMTQGMTAGTLLASSVGARRIVRTSSLEASSLQF